ncbi:hypothetical protein B0H13DRAFT_2173131 [Mycena leptocephala]|nr:hypothetical protein B0H13DRAFT_2173131 [Mycena leptocephala]
MSKATQPLLVNVSPGAGLPPYQQSAAAVNYQAVPITLRIEVQPYRSRRSPLCRCIGAFLVAVGFWAVLNVLVAHHKHHGYGMLWGDHWDIPSDVVLDRCVGGGQHSDAWAISDGLHSSGRDHLEIPLNPDTVLLVSRYRSSSFFAVESSLSGSLDITTSTQLNKTAKIIFQSLEKRDNIKVCLLAGPDGETGVGIFRKVSWMGYAHHKTFMKISLVLPRSTTPLQLKGIVAELPNFSLNVGNLTDAVEFKSVSLETSNAAVSVKTSNAVITADSLISSDLTLKTSNAGITGTFNTSGSLHMTTSNAPITVTVGLESNAEKRPTTLVMRTSNNRLDAKVTLVTDARKGGNFSVTGTTSNGPLTIAVPGFMARTSNGAAEVKLHGAYQGMFMVTTSNFSPVVTRRLNETGDGRRIEYEGEANKDLGRVTVTTSNAPAVLFV